MATLPASAAWDKLYRLRNATGQTAVRAILMGMDVIGAQYESYLGTGEPGYTVVSGVYSTTIDWSGGPVPEGTVLKVGWNTTDHSCQLRDLRWGPDGPTVTAADANSACPGGGILTFDGRTYHLIVPNDNPTLPLQLSGFEVGVFDEPLGPDELSQVLDAGAGVEQAVFDIDVAIGQLGDDVAAYEDSLTKDVAHHLMEELDKAAKEKHKGLKAYGPPKLDVRKALHHWAEAAKHMEKFVSEVEKKRREKKPKLRVPPEVIQDWLTRADNIRAALLALPRLPGPPDGALRELAAGGNEGGTIVVPPGKSITIDIPADTVGPGNAIVMTGDVVAPGGGGGDVVGAVEDGGNIVLEWVEQVTVDEDMTPPLTSIRTVEEGGGRFSAAAVGEGEYGNVILSAQDAGGVKAMYVAREWPDEYPEDAPATGDGGLYFVRYPCEGDYGETQVEEGLYAYPGETIHLVAEDMTGNTSAPVSLVVPGSPYWGDGLVIAGTAATPTGVGAEVTFTLSGKADVSVTVINLAGRPIRHVTTSQAAKRGANSVVWNACGDNGLKVPAGMYLVEVRANARNGQSARAIVPLRLAR